MEVAAFPYIAFVSFPIANVRKMTLIPKNDQVHDLKPNDLLGHYYGYCESFYYDWRAARFLHLNFAVRRIKMHWYIGESLSYSPACDRPLFDHWILKRMEMMTTKML